MSLFDVYIAIDWSARSRRSRVRPSPDAVWIGERSSEGADETYWRTRVDGLNDLRERLMRHGQAGRRVLVGWDFALGYPRGFARAIGVSAESDWHGHGLWAELAWLVEDRDNNSNNRFAVAAELNVRCGEGPGPLWGRPPSFESESLARTSPGFPYQAGDIVLNQKRSTERTLPGAQPVWKLLGVGSVGSQTLLGIPSVCRMRHDPELEAISRVWPFETGFTREPVPDAGPAILHAEIWPGIAPLPLDPEWIRDRAQVRAVAEWFSRLDASGDLGALFDAPPGLTDEDLRACLREEGWILGAGMSQS